MRRSVVTNFIMAVGLVMFYFFIDGLAVDMKQTFLSIQVKQDLHPIEVQAISPAQDEEIIPVTNLADTQIEKPETPAQVVTNNVPSAAVESQGFYAPTESERPNQISPLGESAPLSEIPMRLIIPVINLDASILSVKPELVKIGGVEFQQWLSPDEYAAGWHESSAKLGEVGNTVLNGHHNVYGEVFKRLAELVEGDQILIFSDQHAFTYKITNVMILPEMDEPMDVRVKNAQWIMPSQDERLTLITCWPYYSNTHRLIIVAKPISVAALPDIDQELLPRYLNENGLSEGGK